MIAEITPILTVFGPFSLRYIDIPWIFSSFWFIIYFDDLSLSKVMRRSRVDLRQSKVIKANIVYFDDLSLSKVLRRSRADLRE